MASDNGHEPGAGTAGDLRGAKAQLYEGGIRSPLIVWGPGLIAESAKPGTSNDRTVIAGIDFAPTLLAVAGVPAPDGITFDGRDMSGVLLGKSLELRGAPLMWVRPPDRPGPEGQPLPDLAIRDGDWKLLIRRDGSGAELFDVIRDPDEKNNLSAAQPEVTRRLSDAVIAWDKSIQAAATAKAAPATTPAASASNAKKPNFLLVIADDLCWRDMGFTGNKDVQTSNLDKLRDQSMYLSRMYSPATTCSPSRHALYTGLYCVRMGGYPNHTRANPGTRSIFTHLKQAGYRVALQNKSHVGPEESFPYEHIAGADDLSQTKAFIIRDLDQPWLLVYASNDPHGPWTRGPKNVYDPAKLTVPPYLHDNQTTREQLAAYYAEITMLDQQVGNLLSMLDDAKQAQDTMVVYVSEQGSSFPYGGKWSVYENGIRAATLVRWPGKIKAGSSSNALVQYVDIAPTFLAAAGVEPSTIDTGCPDATGNRGFDGRNFLDVLLGKSDRFRDVVLSQHTTLGINGAKEAYPMRSAGDMRYKYIRNLAPDNTYSIGGIHKGQPIESWQQDAKTDPALAKRVDWLFHRPAEELYDLEIDPYEMKNLADEPSLAEVKSRLSRQLDTWMAQQGDKGMATENDYKAHLNAQRAAKEDAEGAPTRRARKGRE